MGSISILFTNLATEKKSRQWQDLNPGLLCGKQECFLCAMQPPEICKTQQVQCSEVKRCPSKLKLKFCLKNSCRPGNQTHAHWNFGIHIEWVLCETFSLNANTTISMPRTFRLGSGSSGLLNILSMLRVLHFGAKGSCRREAIFSNS